MVDVSTQTQALKNLEQILIAAGSSKDKILRTMVYVTSLDDIPKMNEAYSAFFSDPKPVSWSKDGLKMGS